MLENLRLTLRTSAKNPGFTALAVLVLALGTGANTTVFSIIDAVMFKPVMMRHPERLVGVYQHEKGRPDAFEFFSYPDFADLRAGKDAAFGDLFAFGPAAVAIRGDLTEKIQAAVVSANYFTALGVPPLLGRVFRPDEETSGAPVAVLGHAFWKKLGADPGIVGRTLKLVGTDVTVVGVMPKGFTGAQVSAPAMFLPPGFLGDLAAGAGQLRPRVLEDRGDRRFMLMGILKPGFTLANVNSGLSLLNERFPVPDPREPKQRTLVCRPPARFGFGNQPEGVNQALLPVSGMAFGMSTLVMFIACLNLANMMLARGAARRKEIAVRLALGAGRRRVLGQLMTEGLVLAVFGGLAGLLISVWATMGLAAFVYSGMPAELPKLDFSPDWRVLCVLLFSSGLTTLFFALWPAWSLSRLDINSGLKRNAAEDDREGRRGRFGARDLFAIGQMAAALALLVAAALFTTSAMNVAGANPGFKFQSNFYLAIDSGLTGVPAPRMRLFVREAVERLSSLPGVESVSPAMNIPFGDSDMSRGVQLGGAPLPSDSAATFAEGRSAAAFYNVVGADYFRTIGLPLRAGREFNRGEADGVNSPPVAVISRNLADQFWPDGDAVGRSIQFPADRPGEPPKVMTVVGVAPAVDWHLFETGPHAEVYVPFGQDFQPDLKLHVRVAPGTDPARLMAAARRELRRLDPLPAVTAVQTLSDLQREGSNARLAALGSLLFGAFGVLAACLSALGIYGLKAYSVARRAREIAIRMALGATRGRVLAMIFRETTWTAAAGIGFGLLFAFGLWRAGGAFLYRVQSSAPLLFAAASVLLLAVTFVACLVPARRAANANPLSALRRD